MVGRVESTSVPDLSSAGGSSDVSDVSDVSDASDTFQATPAAAAAAPRAKSSSSDGKRSRSLPLPTLDTDVALRAPRTDADAAVSSGRDDDDVDLFGCWTWPTMKKLAKIQVNSIFIWKSNVNHSKNLVYLKK